MANSKQIAQRDGQVMGYANGLLDDYLTQQAAWKRFLTGNNSTHVLLRPFNWLWGKHHLAEVGLIRRPGPDAAQNIVELLYQLHRIRNVRPKGDLARCLQSIWRHVLNEQRIAVLAQSFHTSHSPERIMDAPLICNGLIVAITWQPALLERILPHVLALEDAEERCAQLQHALRHAFGVRRDSGRGYYQDWSYLQAVAPLLDAVNSLGFQDKKDVLLPALLWAKRYNRLASYDQILLSLFRDYPNSPSRNDRVWIDILASSPDDEHDAVLKAMDAVIQEHGMSIPKWFKPGASWRRPSRDTRLGSYFALFQPAAVQDSDEDSLSLEDDGPARSAYVTP